MTAAPLSRSTSLFLDLLRLLAAFLVFAFHVGMLWHPDRLNPLGDLGHRAVILFFVLSGYVIAYATFRREARPRDYVLARLSRLYSVILPALVLTALLQIVGQRWHPDFYSAFDRGHDLLRFMATAFCVQSLGRSNLAPPTDGPFWSLGYEAWYYVLFGVAIFVRGKAARLVAVLVVLLVSGIDSLLLLPTWLLGVWLYLGAPRRRLGRGIGAVVLALLVAVTLEAVFHLPNWPRVWGRPPFWHSSAFLTDNLLALLVAAIIWTFDAAFSDVPVSARFDARMRWAADHTFSLYLYHFPLLLFAAAVLPVQRFGLFASTVAILGVLAVIVGLSVVTESARPSWRRFFGGCWDWCHRLAA